MCFEKLAFCSLAFFGTGNIASISSFDVSSTYRFVTIYNPYFMGLIILLKVIVPFLLVCCVFVSLMRMSRVPILSSALIVEFFYEIMTINFFFLVRTEGSWLDIGMSISHFAVSSIFGLAQVVLFFAASGFVNA